MPRGVYEKTERSKNFLGKHHSEETKKRISEARLNQKNLNLSNRIGSHQSIEWRKNMSRIMKERVEKGIHHLWKGGLDPINHKIRNSLEYKLWREAVFERDNWTCIWCNARSKKGKAVILQADHIQPFAYYPELRFDINNGRTLCIDCHRKTDTYPENLRISKLESRLTQDEQDIQMLKAEVHALKK